MDTLADVVAAGRDREGVVFDTPDRTAEYTYREFSTNVWKAGNLLRYYGVGPGRRMAVVVGPKDPLDDDEPGTLGDTPEPVLAILGGAVVGSTVDLTPTEPIDTRAVVLPDSWLDRYELAPGCSAIAYGGPPEDPEVAHFERELWSENPTEPPEPISPDDIALTVQDSEYRHGELVAAGSAVADEYGLTAADSIAIDSPLTTAGAIAAGIVAPLTVGATVLLGGEDPLSTDVTYVLSDSTAGERVVDPATVL